MAEPLLSKDAINVGGHKLPLPLVGALVGALGLIVVLRARRSGGNIASAGQSYQPAAAGVSGQDSQAQLANIEQGLFNLGQQLSQQPAGSSAAPPPPTPAGPPSPWMNVGNGLLSFVGQGASITENTSGDVSVYGTALAPWMTGLTPGPGAIGSTPQSVWQWLAQQFAFLGLGPPPTSGTLTGFLPSGATWTVPFRAPGALASGPTPPITGPVMAPGSGPKLNPGAIGTGLPIQ